jgi:hypothetical protein
MWENEGIDIGKGGKELGQCITLALKRAGQNI